MSQFNISGLTLSTPGLVLSQHFPVQTKFISPALAGDISIGSTDTTLPPLFVAGREKINTTELKNTIGEKRNSLKAITI